MKTNRSTNSHCGLAAAFFVLSGALLSPLDSHAQKASPRLLTPENHVLILIDHLAVLSEDYFNVPEERIKSIQSALTLLGGKVVFGAGEFTQLAPPDLATMPDWSPARHFGGYGAPKDRPGLVLQSVHPPGCGCVDHRSHARDCTCPAHVFNASDVLSRLFAQVQGPADRVLASGPDRFFGVGCDCFAF